MATHEKSRKRFPIVGIILLILFLLVAGTAGYLYYSICKAPLELDDPQVLAASTPMSPAERFRFFPADQTVQVRIDTGDLWNLILTNAGSDFLDTVNAELSVHDLSVSGCAIRIAEDSLQLDLEVFFREIRLVVHVPCTLKITADHFSLVPTGLKLGTVPIPAASLLSLIKLEYDLQLPAIRDVTQIRYTQDALLITGSMEEDVRALLPAERPLLETAIFSENLQPLVDSLLDPDGFAVLMAYLEQHPGSIEDLYRDLFTLADPELTDAYLNSRYGLTQRFFPGIDFSAAAAEHTALREQCTALSKKLDQFFTVVVYDYNNKALKLSDGVFLRKRKPFHPLFYGDNEYGALFKVLDPDSFFLILVDVEDGYIRKTPSFYRIADKNQKFTQSVDFNKTYILGCVFRSVDGQPFLMYEQEHHQNNTYFRSIVLKPLTEEDAASLQVPGTFGVWTD